MPPRPAGSASATGRAGRSRSPPCGSSRRPGRAAWTARVRRRSPAPTMRSCRRVRCWPRRPTGRRWPTARREAQVTAGDTASLSGRPDVLDGPFTTPQLLRLDEALRLADQSTGLTFSVYVGDLDEPTREYAEKLHSQLPDPEHSVLLAISPNQRALEIVTGAQARRRIPDRSAKLAALSMAAAFTGGDLTGGVVTGIAQLTEYAGKAPLEA